MFTCRGGSLFRHEPHSTVRAINQSTLVIGQGAVYEVGEGAVLDIGPTAGLVVRAGATLRVSGRGHVEINPGAYICLEPGAVLELADPLSVVSLRPGYLCGIPTGADVEAGGACASLPTTHPIVGMGKIIECSGDMRCIQNISYTHDAYETGSMIRAGNDVCDPPFGDVAILPGANVIFDAEGSVLLKNGLKVHAGASLEVR